MSDCALLPEKHSVHDVPGADGSFGAVSTSSLSPSAGLLLAEIVCGHRQGARMICAAESTGEVIPCVGSTLRAVPAALAQRAKHQRPSLGCMPRSAGCAAIHAAALPGRIADRDGRRERGGRRVIHLGCCRLVAVCHPPSTRASGRRDMDAEMRQRQRSRPRAALTGVDSPCRVCWLRARSNARRLEAWKRLSSRGWPSPMGPTAS